MEWLKNNCFLVDGNNVKRPVFISTVRTSPFERTSFEGYFQNEFLDSIYQKPIKNIELIKQVVFNDPATIVIWADGTKTVVKCQEGDTYDEEKGLALCIAKKYLGNKGNFNEVFKKWVPVKMSPVEELRLALEKIKKRLEA